MNVGLTTTIDGISAGIYVVEVVTLNERVVRKTLVF